jgi:hypothetical protein
MSNAHKDVWDVLVALTPLIVGLLVVGVGAVFTHIYNFRQLQLNQINALDKLHPLLVSEKAEEREFAYSCFVALGYAAIAVRIIRINEDQSGRKALEQVRESGPHPIRAEASSALSALDKAVKLVKHFEFGTEQASSEEADQQMEPYAAECQTLAGQLGLGSKLGQAIVLDTLVHHGSTGRKLIEQTSAALRGTPADGGSEERWLRELLRRRRDRYKGSRHPGIARIVGDRVAVLEKLLDEGQWDLPTPP